MTKLPERRNPEERIPLKPREEIPGHSPTKLPEHRGDPPRERQSTQPRDGHQAVAFTRLPEHRHSDQEVEEIRRREALSVRPPLAYLQSQLAPLPVIVLGYMLAAGAGIAWFVAKEDWLHARMAHGLGVAGGAAAVVVALLIALKKPRSRHHAAFIAIVALLAIVICVLQLIPHADAT